MSPSSSGTALPTAIEERVVSKLFGDAHRLGWTHMTPSEHTRQYAIWVDDPEIGGVLEQFKLPDGTRHWIKDSVMHEYARALAGVGKFAKYAHSAALGPAELVRIALGQGWEVVPKSESIKPLQCLARRDEDLVRLFWGPAKDFKHLLWAALKSTDAQGAPRAHVLVVEPQTQPIPAGEKAHHARLAARCGFSVSHALV